MKSGSLRNERVIVILRFGCADEQLLGIFRTGTRNNRDFLFITQTEGSRRDFAEEYRVRRAKQRDY